MKVTFPHMGYFHITGKTIFEGIGLDVIVPPPCTKKTLTLGTNHSPEFACLPLKINMGNFIEAAQLGADTIIMGGGVGPCRFGYYAEVQKNILDELGMNYQMIVLEPPDVHIKEVWEKIRYLINTRWTEAITAILLAWQKTYAIDMIEKEVHTLRALEINKGESDQVFKDFIGKIDRAKNKKEVKEIMDSTKKELNQIQIYKNIRPIKIAIVGEIYTVLEPFVNFDMEVFLGRMGVEVYRPLFLSQWINDHLLGGLLPIKGSKKAKRLSSPYLNYFVGGHGRETVGHTIELKGIVDGVIQVAPLTCMPEIVAQSVLTNVSADTGMPVMTVYVDEQTGKAGIHTRIEAFVDMVTRKKDLIQRGHSSNPREIL
ncbi:MAG: CoA protein activase [Bacillota bacterium]